MTNKITAKEYLKLIPELFENLGTAFPEKSVPSLKEMASTVKEDFEASCMLGGFAMGRGFSFKSIADLKGESDGLTVDEIVKIIEE